MDIIIIEFIKTLQNLPAEILTGFEFLFFSFSLFCAFRYFGASGIYVFSALAVTLANIQVLKTTTYFFQTYPVALGSVLFSMTYLGTDILAAHYGPKTARMNAIISFSSQIFVLVSIYLTLGYSDDPCMLKLFSPSPRLMTASLISFLFTQFLNVSIFMKLNKKPMLIRSGISTIISGFIDHVFFSLFAWKILSPKPCNIQYLLFTYILGTYWTRLFINLCATPLIYLSFKIKRKLYFNIEQ